jgi:hypothetical protein
MLIALSLLSMWKESRYGQPVKGSIWFALAILGFCAFVLLAGYLQKARSLEKVSTRIETVQSFRRVNQTDLVTRFFSLAVFFCRAAPIHKQNPDLCRTVDFYKGLLQRRSHYVSKVALDGPRRPSHKSTGN